MNALYDLVDLGNFPTFKFHGNKRVSGELWFVSDRVLKKLDEAEGYPKLYKRDAVTMENGIEALVYYLNEKQWKIYKVVADSDRIVKMGDFMLGYDCR